MQTQWCEPDAVSQGSVLFHMDKHIIFPTPSGMYKKRWTRV